MAPRPTLDRLKCRPDPNGRRPDELVSLAEAAALFFPHGPMTANALRIAYARGEVGGAEICGKLYTTPAAVAALVDAPRPQAGDTDGIGMKHASFDVDCDRVAAGGCVPGVRLGDDRIDDVVGRRATVPGRTRVLGDAVDAEFAGPPCRACRT